VLATLLCFECGAPYPGGPPGNADEAPGRAFEKRHGTATGTDVTQEAAVMKSGGTSLMMSFAPSVPACGAYPEEVRVDARVVFRWLLEGDASGWLGWHAKRAIDVLLAGVLLILTSPILLGAMLAIRLTTRGPVIFEQRRAGYRGRPLSMYKLRTMIDGAALMEEDLKEAGRTFFKLDGDPRVTRVGAFLRRTSIDELPQLLNVLRGDMSLVGPRPLLMSDLVHFPDSAHRLRFAMLPGITGLWQVSGRSKTSDADRLRLDQEYVEGWSLWLDLKILIRTVPAVLSTCGAA
jgi:lipopolysaccharide/colanic/teichoic acid biosynthesis glycosyltransferase